MSAKGIPKARQGTSSLNIPFGLSQTDGQLYEPRQVSLGKNCGCICPACKQPVVAKHCLAEKVEPHFAHTPGAECAKGYETALHLAAKQLIDERRTLVFPELTARVTVRDALHHLHSASQEIVQAGSRVLNSVVLEKSLGEIRPDLIIDALGIGRVLVEIAVTHFVDDIKLAKVKATQTPTIEVDVSALRNANFSELRRVLFDEPDNTKWLFHPEVAEVDIELKKSLEGMLKAALEAIQRSKEREKEHQLKLAAERAFDAKELWEKGRPEREARHKELKNATAFKARPEAEKMQILLNRLKVSTLPEAAKVRVRGARSFGVRNPHIWQATLFGGLIHQQAANGQSFVKKDFAVDWLHYRFESTPEFPESEQIAVWDYLNGLTELGALVQRNKDYFDIAIADFAALEALAALRTGRVSLDKGLVWAAAEFWPTNTASHIIACSLQNTQQLNRPWKAISSIFPKVRKHTPIEFCETYDDAGVSLKKEDAIRYLVCAGYLVFPASR